MVRYGHLRPVETDQAQAVAYGISAVPTFVVNGKYGVSGAQAPETFVDVFRKVTEEGAEAPS
ncbi:MAG: DsbA family protein [Solirubrobacterales bacterium]|nr:DsbA family protein [Solirubrobacterales bacterium]